MDCAMLRTRHEKHPVLAHRDWSTIVNWEQRYVLEKSPSCIPVVSTGATSVKSTNAQSDYQEYRTTPLPA